VIVCIVVLLSFLALLTVADLLPMFAEPHTQLDHRTQP
jgi:hypothetical protein